MTVLVTGAFGRVGMALVDNQSGQFNYGHLDWEPHPSMEAVVADISEYDGIEGSFDGHSGVVHLAAASSVDAD